MTLHSSSSSSTPPPSSSSSSSLKNNNNNKSSSPSSSSYYYSTSNTSPIQSSYSSPSSPRLYHNNENKKVGLFTLAILMFYTVSGGAYGIEEIVKAGGPFYALLGFSLLIVWAIPEALVTAELSTALPEASGSVSWCTIAFGSRWGFLKGWLSFLSGVADNSLYPILFFDYIVSLLSGLNIESDMITGWSRWIIIAILTLLLTYINYRGLDVVGMTAIGLCIFSLLPLLIFCILGSFKVNPSNWLITPPGGLSGVNWPLYLNTFFWNINYWESSACYAGDVHNPGVNYPIALFIAILLVTISTSLPILIGTGASHTSYTQWEDGYLTYLAVEIGGPWLGCWMMAGAMMSNIGMFEAEMSSDSWQVAGMADRGIIPKIMGYRNQYGTPTYGILLSASGVLVLCWLSFSEVIEMLNILYCFAQLIEFVAFVYLRIKYPSLKRPFKIPLNTFGVCLMLTLPIIFIFIIIFISSFISVFTAFILCLLGFVVCDVLEYMKRKEMCIFENQFENTCPSLQTGIDDEKINENTNHNNYNDDLRVFEEARNQEINERTPLNIRSQSK